uniref:hypothetical protein n=1 Tax=Candidatus Entotheonella palauensis TaxID=93172 RepID=UPI001C4DEAC8
MSGSVWPMPGSSELISPTLAHAKDDRSAMEVHPQGFIRHVRAAGDNIFLTKKILYLLSRFL